MAKSIASFKMELGRFMGERSIKAIVTEESLYLQRQQPSE